LSPCLLVSLPPYLPHYTRLLVYRYNCPMKQQLAAYRAAEESAAAFRQGIGDHLHTLYLFGSLADGSYRPGRSNVNLLAVVDEAARLPQLRAAFQPAWRKHGKTLQRAPLLATPTTLARYTRLRPDFAWHLAQHGRPLLGQPLTGLPTTEPRPLERLSPLALQAMAASAALAPQLLSPEAAEQSLTLLRGLAYRLAGVASETATAGALFAQVQAALAPRLATLPVTHWTGLTYLESPPLLPQLLAIYEETDQIVLILPEMSAADWLAIDWDEVAGRLLDQYYGLQVATPAQLRLVMAQERAADLRLGRVRHIWGAHPIEALEAATGRILHSAARLAARLHLDDLPNTYLTSTEAQDNKIIHDFQNRLLNVQLQHELLHRLAHLPRSEPPIPLPDRTTPTPQRIEAIAYHFDWWADHYTAELLRHEI
jgi:hypothetical protein